MTERMTNLTKGAIPIGTAISMVVMMLGGVLWQINELRIQSDHFDQEIHKVRDEMMSQATREFDLMRTELHSWRTVHTARIHDGAASTEELGEVKVELRAINDKLDRLILTVNSR